MVDVGLFAVATPPGSEVSLASATADLENRAGEARLRLRRSYGAQDEVFASTLGVGFVPGPVVSGAHIHGEHRDGGVSCSRSWPVPGLLVTGCPVGHSSGLG